ncbi:MAG: FAD-dependent oxidoreductase [Clostridiales bacterium]|nr:FAD-dependent oxidoreductase [Clostridiales bacterium]
MQACNTYNYSKTIFCDVAIIGGGVSGCAAAIESARKGMHTIIFEKEVSLGGLATNGYVPQLAGNVEGICLEFAKRLEAMGQLRKNTTIGQIIKTEPDKDFYFCPSFEPEYGKIVLEDMIFEAGARVIYSSTLFDVNVENDIIKSAVFFTKGGYVRVIAKIYIDSTGDGDLAALSGVPFEVGGYDFAGMNASTTQGSRWAGANMLEYLAAEEAWQKEQRAKGEKNPQALVYVLEEEAIKRGEVARHVCNPHRGFFRVVIPNTPPDNLEFVTFAFHSYYCRNTDAEDISRQVLEQHQLMKQWHMFMRNNVPGFQNLRLVGLGSLPGVRDTRRIFGEYMLKASDIACGTKFEDGIARFPDYFDTHHPTSEKWFFMRHIHIPEPAGTAVCEADHIGVDCDAQMHPLGVPAGVPARVNPRDYCEIPYRCLIPEKIENLFCAGRCCSSEFHANGAMRIIAPAMGTGHAAGLAASIAVREKLRPRDIDGKRIRNLLIDEGVRLNEPCDGHWKEQREMEGDFAINWGDTIVIMPPNR